MLDRVEIDEICKTYYEQVFKFCMYYTNNKSVAEELTQETFVTFLNKAGELENANIRSWLMTVAHYKFLKYSENLKKEKNRLSIVEDLDFIDSITQRIERNFVTEVSQKHVSIVFSKLNKKEMQLYELYYINNLSYTDIANKLGVKEGTLYTRMHRLKDKVLKIIEEDILFF